MQVVHREKGGVRINLGYGTSLNATWPFASLEIDDAKEIKISVLGKKFFYQSDEVEKIEKIKWLPWISEGIKILAKDKKRPPIIFWSFNNNVLINKLESQGIRVVIEIKRS